MWQLNLFDLVPPQWEVGDAFRMRHWLSQTKCCFVTARVIAGKQVVCDVNGQEIRQSLTSALLRRHEVPVPTDEEEDDVA